MAKDNLELFLISFFGGVSAKIRGQLARVGSVQPCGSKNLTLVISLRLRLLWHAKYWITALARTLNYWSSCMGRWALTMPALCSGRDQTQGFMHGKYSTSWAINIPSPIWGSFRVWRNKLLILQSRQENRRKWTHRGGKSQRTSFRQRESNSWSWRSQTGLFQTHQEGSEALPSAAVDHQEANGGAWRWWNHESPKISLHYSTSF